MDNTDDIHRIYAHIKQLEAIPIQHVTAEDARNYNALVKRLINLGYHADEFLIPEHEFKLVGPTRNRQLINGRPHVRYGIMHQKIGALLLHTELVQNAKVVDFDLPRGN